MKKLLFITALLALFIHNHGYAIDTLKSEKNITIDDVSYDIYPSAVYDTIRREKQKRFKVLVKVNQLDSLLLDRFHGYTVDFIYNGDYFLNRENKIITCNFPRDAVYYSADRYMYYRFGESSQRVLYFFFDEKLLSKGTYDGFVEVSLFDENSDKYGAYMIHVNLVVM